MQRAITILRARGETIDDSLLGFPAPLGWQHINLTGDYLWSAPPELEADGYRRLRTTTDAIAA
ncbi:Tn3 family transposase [Azospirillum sp. RWY-5-1]|uniref:Tn3 family transposase n=2 Tax=Azospirillum oleiclasticum TaxID=2735135 RepID=A0ABX2TLB9_9PROT|nr:Tn3 family transposase [Azospirillum oleiclasticum]NYZ25108.1 Tn3 family transposase [Azospirillum oleiclasticum]